MNIFKHKKGFTLIELLVVIAIIGMLSSVVLASLNSSRGKAKDAAIKEGVAQMVNLMSLNYSDYGNYCALQPNQWINADAACNAANFSGTYATQARAICNSVYANASDAWSAGGGYRMYMGTPFNVPLCNSTYSIEVLLNNGKWYCSGGSGKGEYAGAPNGAANPGCFDNP